MVVGGAMDIELQKLSYDDLAFEADRARRYEAHLSILMVDIDGLGLINERLGKDAGDYVLGEVANVLRSNTRKIDCFGSWEGKDFILVSVDHNVFGSIAMAEKLKRVIARHKFEWEGRPCKVTCSIGVARGMPQNDAHVSQLVATAKYAIARAISAGGNRVEYVG